MKITVLSDLIPTHEIALGLLSHGIVILSTPRPQALELATQIQETFQEESEEDAPWISHLQLEVPDDLGWMDVLYNMDLLGGRHEDYDAAVFAAVKSWASHGTKRKHVFEFVK